MMKKGKKLKARYGMFVDISLETGISKSSIAYVYRRVINDGFNNFRSNVNKKAYNALVERQAFEK